MYNYVIIACLFISHITYTAANDVGLLDRMSWKLHKKEKAKELFYAIDSHYNDGTIEALIEKYPQLINARRKRSGYTPLLELCLLANHRDHPQFVQKYIPFFVERNADVNVMDYAQCWTPLLLATCSCGKIPCHIVNTIVESLLDKGADVNATNMDGACTLTPLMFAARNGYKNLVEILLKYGANRDAIDVKSEKTAADFAKENGHNDIADVIEKYEINKERTV